MSGVGTLWGRLEQLIFEDASTGAAKFSALDGLRGIAVLVVFLSHSSGFDQRLAPWLDFRMTGQIGVYLFFVLSGFMLGYGLLGRSAIPVIPFFARRFLRIAPLYYLVVSAVFFLQVYLHRPEVFSLRVNGGWMGYGRHLVFLQGDSVFWTIAAEFEFYFLLPFICIFLKRLQWTAFVVAAVLCIFYATWGTLIEFGQLPQTWALKIAQISHNTQYLDIFLCGVLASFLARDPGITAWLDRRQMLMRQIGVAMALLITGCTVAFVARNGLGFNQVWPEFRYFSLVYGGVFSLIILAVLHGQGGLAALLKIKPLRMIGITCFSWYLLHFIVIGSVNAVFGHSWNPKIIPAWGLLETLRFLVSFGATFLISIVTYLLIEKPFMMLSRNLLAKRPLVAAAV